LCGDPSSDTIVVSGRETMNCKLVADVAGVAADEVLLVRFRVLGRVLAV